MRKPTRSTAALAIAALALAACTTQQVEEAPAPAAADGDPNSHLVIAEIALQRGDYLAAAREYAAAAASSQDSTLAEQATRVGFAGSQSEYAAQSARRWLELDPKNADAHRYLAIVALRLHRIREATEQFDYLIKNTYPSPGEAFMDLTSLLAEEDNSYGVLAVVTTLAQRNSNLAEAQYAVSVAALRAYNYQVAVDSARRALTLNPSLGDAERVLARSLVVSGRAKEGVELARKRAAAGEDPDAKTELPLLLVASGQDDEARAELAKLVDVPETRPEALRTLASLELSAGNLDQASQLFQDLITTGRYVGLAHFSLGILYERRREDMRAVRFFTRVTSGPYATDSQLRAARLLAGSGASDQANELLDNYVVEHPEAEVEIVIGRARLFTDEGDAETGLQLLEAARERYPDNEGLQYARSITLERLDRVDDAVAQVRTLLARRPDDPVAMNALGYTLAEHSRDLKEARSLVKKALALTPDNPAVLDSMGWVLHRLGEEREALTWLERAYATEKDGEIAAHIGEVHWALGDRKKAREVGRKSGVEGK